MKSKFVFGVSVTAFLLVSCTAAHGCGQKTKRAEKVDINITATSPSQEYVATSYIVSGGGAGGYVYKVVNLRKKSERFDPKKDIIFSVTGTRDVTLSWEGNDHLMIKHSKVGNIYTQAKEWGSDKKVRISYLGTD